MKSDKIKIEYVDPANLIPADYNPRELTEKQAKDLKRSLELNGFIDPAIVNSNPDRKNIIIGGHQRCKVAQMLGIKQVPVVYINKTLKEERELNVRLNKNTGQWDWDMLANEFDESELIEWGFDPIEFRDEDDRKDLEDQKDLSDDLDIQYKIEVDLENEERQESLFNHLQSQGYICRILTL